MARIVVSGGTGYIGRALVQQLVARGDAVTVLTRGAGRDGNPTSVSWDPYQVGDWAKALAEVKRSAELWEPDHDAHLERTSHPHIGHLYAVSGRTADARSVLRRMEEESRKSYVWAHGFALIYAGLGERDEAFRWLRKVEQDPTEDFAFVHLDPRLSELRSDSRFADVLRLMRLPR